MTNKYPGNALKQTKTGNECARHKCDFKFSLGRTINIFIKPVRGVLRAPYPPVHRYMRRITIYNVKHIIVIIFIPAISLMLNTLIKFKILFF